MSGDLSQNQCRQTAHSVTDGAFQPIRSHRQRRHRNRMGIYHDSRGAETMIYSARYPLARRRFSKCEIVPGEETPMSSQSSRTGGIIKRRLSSITRNSSCSRGVSFGALTAVDTNLTIPHLTGCVQLYV